MWKSANTWIGSFLYSTFATFVMFTVLTTVYDTNQRIKSLEKDLVAFEERFINQQKVIVETRKPVTDTNQRIRRIQLQ